MRTREEIYKDLQETYSNFNHDKINLEILLDIRDLLKEQIEMFAPTIK